MSGIVEDKYGIANCVVCGKPSETYMGHFHVNGKTVAVGWCYEHTNSVSVQFSAPFDEVCSGCYGHLSPVLTEKK